MLSSDPTTRIRALASSGLMAGLLLLAPGSASGQASSASPIPPADSTESSSPAPMASPTATDIVFYALPAAVAETGPDIPTVGVEPASTEALEIGQPIDLELGHCGLWSPLDLDGSLWQADGGVTPSGGPIAEDDDAVIGELINATPGVFVIVSEDAAHFTTATGTILSLARAPGALDFPLCM